MVVAMAIGAAAVAGCAHQAPANPTPAAAPPSETPGSEAVTVPVSCGVRQLYWHGAWWKAQDPFQRLRGDGFARVVSGTMTMTGPGQARFDSDGLVGPETMSVTSNRQPNQPPLGACRTL